MSDERTSGGDRQGPGGDRAPWDRDPDPTLSALETELAGVARRVERKIDPGAAALVAAVGTLAVVGALLLPWIEGATGWQLLVGAQSAGPLPRLFTFTLTAFGIVTSTLALTTRYWALAWISAVGCGISVVNGVWAVWSRQTVAPEGVEGPGPGLILAVLGVVLLTFTWARISLQRR
ncbi:Rv2732c family membrane protein [Pseudonocardia halophobica]|uniref:Rv2732c family membrane protein n=1 Tax=Pseudonocardia halophobica TaxID=29401 RepID=UPI003D8F7C10